VGLKIALEGKQDWTGSLGMWGCLVCFPGYALNYVEGRLEGCGHSAGGLKTMPMATARFTVLEFQLWERSRS
jgi:hypothetical protein